MYPVESFNLPLDIGSCRRQVLLPVIEKPAALTVPSVPVACNGPIPYLHT